MKAEFFWFFLGRALLIAPSVIFWPFYGHLLFFALELLAGLIWVMKPTVTMSEIQLVQYLTPPVDSRTQAW
jgi:hypothetical protein